MRRKQTFPRQIETGYRRLRVRAVGRRALGNAHGDFNTVQCLVRVKNTDSPAEQANTLIHECFHNELWETGLKRAFLSHKAEELVVRNLANAVSRMLSARRNSQLRRFLIKTLKDA